MSGGTRDSRIDFLRGFFILSMAADHLGHLLQAVGNQSSAKLYTYQSLGWSSAAEFFVFFSGYVVASVYGRTLAAHGYWRTQLRGLHRSWELYVRNALVFLAVLVLVPLLSAGPERLFAATRLDLAAGAGLAAVPAFLGFAYFPTFLEVLPLYMLLMAAAPLVLWLHARNRWLPLVLSGALWLAVQRDPGLNLHTPGPWHFNPLAWQFVFVLGLWLAREAPLAGHTRTRRGVLLVLALLALCAVLKALDKAGMVQLPGLGKTDLAPLRLLHFLLVLWLIALAMPSDAWVRAHRLTRAVARVGAHSLDCFSASIVVCYLLAAGFAWSERGTLAYVAVQGLNLAALVALAQGLQWLKTPPWRAPPGGHPRAAAALPRSADEGQPRWTAPLSTSREPNHA